MRSPRTGPPRCWYLVLHALPSGSQFDLTSRTLIAHQTALPDHEMLESRAAGADLRKLAEDMAAEGVSPTNYAWHVRRSRRRPE